MAESIIFCFAAKDETMKQVGAKMGRAQPNLSEYWCRSKSATTGQRIDPKALTGSTQIGKQLCF